MFAREPILGGAIELVREDGDRPSPVILAHRQQPLKTPLNLRMLSISSQDEQRHDRAAVVGRVLVGEHATEIPLRGLAGKQEFGRLLDLGMLPIEAVLLYEVSQLPACLDETIVDGCRRWRAAWRPG